MTKCDFCVCFQPKFKGETQDVYKCWSNDMNKDCSTAINLMIKTLSSGSRIYLNADKTK